MFQTRYDVIIQAKIRNEKNLDKANTNQTVLTNSVENNTEQLLQDIKYFRSINDEKNVEKTINNASKNKT
jgi:hypothetical protein